MMNCDMKDKARKSQKRLLLQQARSHRRERASIQDGTISNCSLVCILHCIPIHSIPPSLKILIFSADAVIHHPNMFPRVYAQKGSERHPTRSEIMHCFTGGGQSKKAEASVRLTCRGDRFVIHVDSLLSSESLGVRCAGNIGGEDLEQTRILLSDKPDESGAELSTCSGEKVLFQGFWRRGTITHVRG